MKEVFLSYNLKPSLRIKNLFGGFFCYKRFCTLCRSTKPIKQKRLALLIAILFVLAPDQAQADIVIPTFMIVFPAIPYLLIPIIILEAWVGKRINLNWDKAFQISIIANLVSTLLGIPITYIIVGGAANIFYSSTPKGGVLFTISKYLLQPFVWFPGMPVWVYPLSIIVLLVPMFFVTVWVEQFVAGKILKNETDWKNLAKRWSRSANIASYSLLAIVVLGWFIADIVF